MPEDIIKVVTNLHPARDPTVYPCTPISRSWSLLLIASISRRGLGDVWLVRQQEDGTLRRREFACSAHRKFAAQNLQAAAALHAHFAVRIAPQRGDQ